MTDTTSGVIDGIIMRYTYDEMGTVRVSYESGHISFEWLAGPLAGEAGSGFPYRARKVGAQQYFVNWHEPELPGFVTLFIDFDAGHVHSSLIAWRSVLYKWWRGGLAVKR